MHKRSNSGGALSRTLRPTLVAAAVVGLVGLAGCEGDTGPRGAPGTPGVNGAPGNAGAPGAPGANGSDGINGQPAFAPATLFVASNGASDTQVRVRNEALGLLNAYTTGANEGVVVDAAGQLVQAGDLMGTGRVVTACNAVDRSSGDATREVTGGATGLANAKGIVRIDDAGLIVVANNGASNLLVLGAAAAGNVAPVATVGLSTNAWDAVYDDRADRLFVALVNGSVAVFDSFVSTLGVGGANRSFSIQDSTGAASVNLHGIDYDPVGDRLVVSDVGLAGSPDDGKLYVVANASNANGVVTATTTFAGANTRLGNPVDLDLEGTDVRIAEKANGGGALLIYRNIFERGTGGNVAADVVLNTPAPESLAVVPVAPASVGVTDIIDPATAYRLLTTSNPAVGSPTSGQLFRSSRTLAGAPALQFDVVQGSIENVTLDRNGDAYVTFDDGSTANSGIAVVGALSARTGVFTPTRDRIISGANTRLQSPKGVEMADDLGLVIVAENAGAEVLVFSACASGNATPTVVSTGGVAPWDSDYDPSGDTLYVALVNGTVAAYDGFSLDLGADGPDRVLTPVQAGLPFAAPTNLHGIRYDQRSDTLIISDVGAAGSATDGALMTLPFASSATGNVEVGKRIAGPATLLGNPVDIAFDGVDLYVAEKANGGGFVQVWRNFLTNPALVGDVAPSALVAATAVESVVLMPIR